MPIVGPSTIMQHSFQKDPRDKFLIEFTVRQRLVYPEKKLSFAIQGELCQQQHFLISPFTLAISNSEAAGVITNSSIISYVTLSSLPLNSFSSFCLHFNYPDPQSLDHNSKMQKDLKMACFFKFMKLRVNIHVSLQNTNVFNFRALPQTPLGTLHNMEHVFSKA